MGRDPEKWYVVWAGKVPGIYEDWTTCSAQVTGVKGSKYKSYKGLSRAEVEQIFAQGYQSELPVRNKATYRSLQKSETPSTIPEIEEGAIAVDAACSGNPGKMEYRGVLIESGEVLFASPIYVGGTNNIGEYLAIVHALAMLIREQRVVTIYSDSRTAISWVYKRKCNSKLVRNSKTNALWEIIERADLFLQTHDFSAYRIIKWDTKRYGEIPADYGRK